MLSSYLSPAVICWQCLTVDLCREILSGNSCCPECRNHWYLLDSVPTLHCSVADLWHPQVLFSSFHLLALGIMVASNHNPIACPDLVWCISFSGKLILNFSKINFTTAALAWTRLQRHIIDIPVTLESCIFRRIFFISNNVAWQEWSVQLCPSAVVYSSFSLYR